MRMTDPKYNGFTPELTNEVVERIGVVCEGHLPPVEVINLITEGLKCGSCWVAHDDDAHGLQHHEFYPAMEI